MKSTYKIKGIDCANCAAQLENAINKVEGVQNASISFMTDRMVIEYDEQNKDEIMKRIKKVIKKEEPDATLEEIQEELVKKRKNKIIIATILFIVALIIKFSSDWINKTIYIFSYLIVGTEIVKKAIRNIIRGKVFDENFLMTIATIGAFAIGEFPEAVAVMLFYQVGELFQSYAVNKSRKSIASLINIRPDYANLLKNNQEEKVDPNEVKLGDIIIVKPGEKVPLDGKVIEGTSMLDTSVLTGAAIPRGVTVGDEILSGCINKEGLLKVQVTKEFGESTVSKILDLVENASNRKA